MKKVLAIFGEGGHYAQMKRLQNELKLENKNVVAIVDSKSLDLFTDSYVALALREKNSFSIYYMIRSFIFNMRLFFHVISSYELSVLISTGPGLCIFPALAFTIMGKPVIFIETWSRFETKSITGRVMYIVANRFYVQNKELLKIYPNAIYSGRL
jgi:UDP-N-acetylglucosamine:LPS N-acetylglucosamine transferase